MEFLQPKCAVLTFIATFVTISIWRGILLRTSSSTMLAASEANLDLALLPDAYKVFRISSVARGRRCQAHLFFKIKVIHQSVVSCFRSQFPGKTVQ